jgi:serine/threonine protein kinase
VTFLSDTVLAHLRAVADQPDLGDTRYEVREEIGRGGMGVVYLAQDTRLDRPVALKVLNAPAGEQASARLVREARVIAQLEHPGIVPVHDSGVLTDGRFYYAMKLVRGQRLDEPGAVPTELTERLLLFQKICDAIAFAHAHGVLHRDLKPQNIMLGPFGEVLVMDWGLAKQAGAPQQPGAEVSAEHPSVADAPDLAAAPAGTADGTILGTPGYMAPEQARGEVALIDERTDVYGLGAILYYLLAGEAPARRLVPEALRLDGSVPRPLAAICRKALAPDRALRYAAVSELAADIANFLAKRAVTAYPEGPLGTARRLVWKYKWVLSVIAAYLVIRILLLKLAGA